MPWLGENYPNLVAPYNEIYRRSYAAKEVSDPIRAAVTSLAARYRRVGHELPVETGRGAPARAFAPPPAPPAEQLSLDLA